MKRLLIALILLASCFSASAKKLPEHLTKLPANLLEKREDLEGRIKIGSITETDFENDADEEVSVLKFYTCQDERDKLNYRMRVTIELTDNRGKGDSYFAQLSCKQPTIPDEYTGETTWEFHLPHGGLEKAKLTAYAVQYGFLDGGVFVPVDEKFDDVDSAEEITERTTTRIEGKGVYLADWTHTYRDE